MYSQNARESMKTILRECATAGTFWNRHFQADDVIDIWREANRALVQCGEEQCPFDVFYSALQKFRLIYRSEFEEAVAVCISTVEARSVLALEEKESPPRRERARKSPGAQRTGTGHLKITGISSP